MPAASTAVRASTRTAILDAALAVMAETGLGRVTLEEVARAAGVSRQTVYRSFGSRDALVAAVVLREEQRLMARMTAAARGPLAVRPALEAAIAEALRAAREHPLLDRLLATEPEALLPFLISGAGPVLSAARPVCTHLITQRLPHLPPATVRRGADALTRLLVSYAINPPDDPVDEVAAGLADLFLNGVDGSLR